MTQPTKTWLMQEPQLGASVTHKAKCCNTFQQDHTPQMCQLMQKYEDGQNPIYRLDATEVTKNGNLGVPKSGIDEKISKDTIQGGRVWLGDH